MSFVIELVVGVEDAPQVDAADLLGGALLLQVALHPLDDGAHLRLVLQVLHVLWQESPLRSAGTGLPPSSVPIKPATPTHLRQLPAVSSPCPEDTIPSPDTHSLLLSRELFCYLLP